MTTYVLVHGGDVSAHTWNRLVEYEEFPADERLGGRVWCRVEAALTKQGHTVWTPTLENEYSHNLSAHIHQITSLIEEHHLQDIILVGHSYGGMIISGVAANMPERINTLVYLDAAVPQPQQSLFDVLRLANYDPIATVRGSPMAYTEALQFNPKVLQPLPKVFISCTDSEFIRLTKIAKDYVENTPHWEWMELTSNHLPQCSHPQALADILLHIAD